MLGQVDQAGCVKNLHQLAGGDSATAGQASRVDGTGTRQLRCFSRTGKIIAPPGFSARKTL